VIALSSSSGWLTSRADGLLGWIERHPALVILGWSLLFFASTIVLAFQKLMWDDEFFSLYISNASDMSSLWAALMTGADQHPPLFYWITRVSLRLIDDQQLAIRVPAMLGFWLMGVSLFAFTARRTSVLGGLFVLLVALVTDLYYYASEGRGYGLALGFTAFALLCWQSAAESRQRVAWLVGLGIALAGAVGSHYYAGLVVVPLGLAELTRSWQRRRVDLPMWVALAAPAIPLLVFFPVIRAARRLFGDLLGAALWLSGVQFLSGDLRDGHGPGGCGHGGAGVLPRRHVGTPIE